MARPNGVAGRNARLLFAPLDVAAEIHRKLEKGGPASNVATEEADVYTRKARAGELELVPCDELISSVRMTSSGPAVLLFTDTPLRVIDAAVCMARMHRFDALFTRLCIDVVMVTGAIDSWCHKHASSLVVHAAFLYCPENTGCFVQTLCAVLARRERNIEARGDPDACCLFGVIDGGRRVAAFSCGYNLLPPDRTYPHTTPALAPAGHGAFDGCCVCYATERAELTCSQCRMRRYCSVQCRAADVLLHGSACRGIVGFLALRAGSKSRFTRRRRRRDAVGRTVVGSGLHTPGDALDPAIAIDGDRACSSCVPASADAPESAQPVLREAPMHGSTKREAATTQTDGRKGKGQ